MTEHQTSTQRRFCALLEPNHERLARFARGMTESSEDARDLVGDTIEQAYEHFDMLKSDEAFLSWIFTIARRIQNRRRWRMKLFDRFNADGYEDIADTHSASSAPEAHVDTQILYDALQRLPHKQREAFVLFEVSGFSLQEIQELQGDSLSAVKMRLVRARDRLRHLLGEIPTQQATIHHLTESPKTDIIKPQQANVRFIRRSP
jgi:RNA polymerase sigma-70 factor, ECF subfamily